ncbi:hypothetical protein [Rubrobacter calidifluminis]|uniref:hypothetical protein n=1 Tax=Rubrobacter calidifluminis TaxID=1392640 RepID=UPI002361D9B3|nr:hypothetical protein [Rubrobacter calidifluminis]
MADAEPERRNGRILHGPSMLDAGTLPVEDLAQIAAREGRRPRPVYGAHRWFARRFGSAFRALLVAAALPEDGDFWGAYYEGADLWRGGVVLDPFVGGGTSVLEARRLGAEVVGVDVDAVACAITRFETRAAEAPDLGEALESLKREVGGRLAPYYRTRTPEGEKTVLHYFWVQVVACASCGEEIEAHPHHRLAYEAEGCTQWVFCPGCHGVHELSRGERVLRCGGCGIATSVETGPVRRGCLTCPSCGHRERLIDVASRTGGPPRWRLFALEFLDIEPEPGKPVPLSGRRFRSATQEDVRIFEAAESALMERTGDNGSLRWVPGRRIPREGRADGRLPAYGYERYAELFNARQLLHLSLLAEAIDGLRGPKREALALALSDHLTANCMMAHYAFGWRRLAPLFSVRAFRHITRPVEINPWLDGTGRGTFPNAVRQVQRAIESARHPREPLLEGGFRPVRDGTASSPARIVHTDSRNLGFIEDRSVDLVLTDPPYLDNVAYSELSDFFLPWMQLLSLAPADGEGVSGFERNLAARGRNRAAVEGYRRALARCFCEVSRVLKPAGRFVFTYQHRTAGAWCALARAMACARLRPVQVFPLLGNGDRGPHNHEGTIRWDAVFVAVEGEGDPPTESLRLSGAQLGRARAHCLYWTKRLSEVEGFREADRCNLLRACLVAAALGCFPAPADGRGMPLEAALERVPALIDVAKEAPGAPVL